MGYWPRGFCTTRRRWPSRLDGSAPACQNCKLPQVPERLWQRLESIDEREFATAVAARGVLITAAAADGYRTGGRSALYQTAPNGFGLHGLAHLAQAAAVRGTPGAATSLLVVIPFSLWARGGLRRAGMTRPARAADAVRGLACTATVVGASHAPARRVCGGGASRGRRTGPASPGET
ncbi:HXXEE domain-containing protein [Streptomyces sp. MNU89]|uniref:HXXEE domain-containing protein n=1 Tax=Streptomyces sp. MNU89 TaxID=2560025 RepID=UPI0035A90CC1